MNLKLLAGFAVAAILMGVGNQSFTHAAFADSNQNRAHAKAITNTAGKEQVIILEQMKIKAHPHAVDIPG
jgi:hypothetical protein